MASECEQLADRLAGRKSCPQGPFDYTEGRMGSHSVVLMQCGIGKVNAAAGSVELIRNYRPDCLISTGVAGGIDARLAVMDVVAAKQSVYHDVWCGDGNAYGQIQGLPARFDSDAALYACATSLHTSTVIHGGLICTGDQFISDHEQLGGIKRHFPEGLAVDMESAAIAQVCFLYHVPFISFRIISDTPGADPDNFSQYLNFWGEMANRSFAVTETFLKALPEAL